MQDVCFRIDLIRYILFHPLGQSQIGIRNGTQHFAVSEIALLILQIEACAD